jgi:hypothetical protein
MMDTVLGTQAFYFSYSFDLTHTQQRLAHTTENFREQPMIDRADPRFVWNNHLIYPFQTGRFANFCLPIIHGYVSVESIYINQRSFDWAIISRRSVHRAGTRYFLRTVLEIFSNLAFIIRTIWQFSLN